ncbi:MAG: T9SS type A sorting domain-containing protein [Candidatus Eisenbacteria bacterium]|nr:T9SS type A sorting domain-containing protein [Candidatus Eisenbacteria bacterium]
MLRMTPNKIPGVIALTILLMSAALSGNASAAEVTIDPPTERIAGGQVAVLTIQYDGTGETVGLRGYHFVIDFDDTYVFIDDLELDVVEGPFLSDVGPTTFLPVMEDGNTLVVDCSILGATTGATGTGVLCTISFTGQATGDGVSPVTFTESLLRDPDNFPIGCVPTGGSIELDNTPPDVPTMAPEPPYTRGLTNTVYWSSESATGAVGYCSECSLEPDFDPIYATSGCTPALNYEYTGLIDGETFYYRVKCRDDLNNTSGWSNVVSSTQDDTAPVSEAGPLDPYHNTTYFPVPFSASDATSGVSSVILYYRVDGGPYQQHPGTYLTSPIPFTAPSEGVYDFYTVARDVAGNVEGVPATPDCSTEVDLTDPAPPVDFVASPEHNAIHLSWFVADSRAAPIEGTLIVRKAWASGAYPEYDDDGPAAGYPATPGGGVVVDFVPGTGIRHYYDDGFDDATRNVYYYTAFTRDLAGNLSPAAPSAQDRSTSYWLADVTSSGGAPGVYDGFVDYYDKVVFSATYDIGEGHPSYNHECDVGPTDDMSRIGIPVTDNLVNFEDLMILAMNYGNVWPTGVPEGGPPARGGRGSVCLELAAADGSVREGAVRVLRLAGERGDVRGVSVTLRVSGSDVEIDVPPCWAEPTEQVFFHADDDQPDVVTVDVAALGPCGTLAPGTELCVLRASDPEILLEIADASVRDVANAPLDWTVTAGGGADEQLELAFLPPTPNPTNGDAELAFSLVEKGDAVVSIFDASGRLVRRFVEPGLEPGRHTLRWDGRGREGRETASGVYFCVLEAGDRRMSRKLVVLR